MSLALGLGVTLPVQGDKVLRTCLAVHGLAANEAKLEKPVILAGTVTLFEKPTNATLFIQDFSGGVYVEAKGIPFSGEPGDRVEITGVTAPGNFAPIVILKSYRVLGPGTMPEAVPITLEGLQMGHADSLRVSFKSRVRSVSLGSKQVSSDPPRLTLELGDHQGGLIQAHLLDWHGIDPASLIHAEVEITGVATGHFNYSNQIVLPRIVVQTGADLQVTKSPLPPERVPFLKIGQIFTFRNETTTERRVRFEGVVVASNAPDWIAIQENGRGIVLQPAPLAPFQIGDTVAVLGYPSIRDLNVFIGGARLEVIGTGELPPPLPLEDLRNASRLHACRVTAQGKLLEPPAMIAGLARLRLETPGGVILVEVPDCATPSASWQTGAQIAATGVCLAEHSPEAMARRFPQPDRITIYVQGPSAVEVRSAAPWWTPRRYAYAMGGLLVVLAAAGFVMLRMGAKTQRLTTRGRELARAEMMRTTQLHEQLAHQHEQQLTFQAVLHERQRLAQELHDSMEQQFASLSMRVDAVLEGAGSSSEVVRGLGGLHHFIEESRSEVHRCIWGLRARALEQRGIGAALHELARQHNAGASPHLTVVEKGTAIPLETTCENHLFRFAQEAVGNALKHAKATEIGLSLEWADESLHLAIRDNGCGLTAGSPVPTALHHRAIALSATMETASVEPSGTQVTLIMNLEPGGTET